MARAGSSGRPVGAPRTRGRRNTKQDEDDSIPEIYREMLAEVQSSQPAGPEPERSTKRRKVGEGRAAVGSTADPQPKSPAKEEDDERSVGKQIQTAYESDVTEESDMDWEEVDL